VIHHSISETRIEFAGYVWWIDRIMLKGALIYLIRKKKIKRKTHKKIEEQRQRIIRKN
jgi:hypothetical protein